MMASIPKLALVLLLIFCSLATTTMVRSSMGVATASIGVLRRTPLLLTPAICTSIVAASIQPIPAVGAAGLASGASSPVSSKIEILGDKQMNESFGDYRFNLVGWKIS